MQQALYKDGIPQAQPISAFVAFNEQARISRQRHLSLPRCASRRHNRPDKWILNLLDARIRRSTAA
jgi:hypothetical protein